MGTQDHFISKQRIGTEIIAVNTASRLWNEQAANKF